MNSGARGVGHDEEALDCRQMARGGDGAKNKRKNFSPKCSQIAPQQLTIAALTSDEEKSPSPLPSQFCLVSNEEANTLPSVVAPEVAKFEFAMKTMQELLSMYGLSISPRDIVDALSKEPHFRPQTASGHFSQLELQQPPTPPETPNATPTGFQQQLSDGPPTAPEVIIPAPASIEPIEPAIEVLPQQPKTLAVVEKKKSVVPPPAATPLLGKYLKKFASFLECGSERCQAENARDHYHCFDTHCHGRCLSKKEEIIRHVKWHKKRSESLTHGFLRFSATDDCAAHFGTACTHNRKQTHYHCLRANCDKVYISTSDVQMHSNYHRKDSVIFQEGSLLSCRFQRFRATEECNTDYCAFSRQRTTHFHCRRSNCRYTFKNKADMEKHKTYHIKDEQLTRDGFKKFLKTEACTFPACRFSKVANHIHCTRENCSYVLHSSGQLISHKRKHERLDSEVTFRRLKEDDGAVEPPQEDFEQLMRVCTVTACRGDADEPLNLKNDAVPAAHFHCACGATVDNNSSDIATHMRTHEETPADSNLLQITSIDGFFNRKRGRPPKNRVVEVYNSVNVAQSPQAIFTSFKLEKASRRPDEQQPPDVPAAHVDPQFEFFDQTTDCLFVGCVNRKLLHHFHCTKCTFSFVSPAHAQTHICDNGFRPRRQSSSSSASCGSTISSVASSALPLKREIEEATTSREEDERISVVRAAGTFFPENSDSSDPSEAKAGNDINVTSCNRPFCKLKKKVHYHCDFCNQAFSEESRLNFHMMKHQMARRVDDESNAAAPLAMSQLALYPHSLMYKNFYPFLEMALPHQDDGPSTSLGLRAGPPLKQPRLEDDVTKSCRMFKDEPIPQGYLKFRFNEDCKFTNCGYRNHQSHFHCCRHDCFYSFCDKTRFVQHTARHERLDKLMGDDFKQYRANMKCGYDNCAYSKATGTSNKSSHFHCLKCDFICSDTNKVVAHRRQHTKLEYIRLAGFRKVSNSENCMTQEADGAACSYSGRQTHYHCLVCNCSVLSRAQLTSHRHRE
ncbi:zinc finger protein castor homolog 1-like isoform X3 [Lutzomyia longipalpis]|uniref:zinc finger protein castor homolog 1-like isoform X3 n=1 Tax=Lutzomyia longipalpis TaxID=7200 RepID=UPI0024840DDC|nr:zinc finger protein castor homolog 1-like isoform X3 [Lutzomyia longipalpis]